jgi:hypothetical protein
MAILTVRIAYEITQMQVNELRAWYSVADCVISESPTCPYWDSLGIDYRTKAEGRTETVGYQIPRPVYHEQVFGGVQ